MTTVSAKSFFLVIPKTGFENHFLMSIRQFDPYVNVTNSSVGYDVETTLSELDIMSLTSVKFVKNKKTLGLSLSQLIDFYKKNGLSGNEPCLAKKHLNAPALHATIDFKMDENKIVITDTMFECPIGKIIYFESIQLSVGNEYIPIYYNDDKVNYVSFICGMIIFGV